MKTKLLLGIGAIAFTFFLVGYINGFHNTPTRIIEPQEELPMMELPQSNIGNIEFHTSPIEPNQKPCYLGPAPSEKYFRYECSWLEKPRGVSLTAMELFSKIHNFLMLKVTLLKDNGGSYQYQLTYSNAGNIDSLEFDVRMSDMSTSYMKLSHGTDENRTLLVSGVIDVVVYLREQLEKDLTMPHEDSKSLLVMKSNRFFEVPIKISNGTVFSLESDVRSFSLLITMIAFDNGNLTITIPRGLLDAKYSCNSTSENAILDKFFVLGNAVEIPYDEIETTNKVRTLNIPFFNNTTSIEIIGVCH